MTGQKWVNEYGWDENEDFGQTYLLSNYKFVLEF